MSICRWNLNHLRVLCQHLTHRWEHVHFFYGRAVRVQVWFIYIYRMKCQEGGAHLNQQVKGRLLWAQHQYGYISNVFVTTPYIYNWTWWPCLHLLTLMPCHGCTEWPLWPHALPPDACAGLSPPVGALLGAGFIGDEVSAFCCWRCAGTNLLFIDGLIANSEVKHTL